MIMIYDRGHRAPTGERGPQGVTGVTGDNMGLFLTGSHNESKE